MIPFGNEVIRYDGVEYMRKFNPYHDPHNGQFTTAEGAGVADDDDLESSSALKPKSSIPAGGTQVVAYEGVQNDAAPSSWGDSHTLQDYFNWHGSDFNATSAEDYASQANQFFQAAKAAELPNAQYPDGDIIVVDPASNTFGAYNSDGTIQSFYKPTSSTYLQRQFDDVISKGGRIIIPIGGNQNTQTTGGSIGMGGFEKPGTILGPSDPFLQEEERE